MLAVDESFSLWCTGMTPPDSRGFFHSVAANAETLQYRNHGLELPARQDQVTVIPNRGPAGAGKQTVIAGRALGPTFGRREFQETGGAFLDCPDLPTDHIFGTAAASTIFLSRQDRRRTGVVAQMQLLFQNIALAGGLKPHALKTTNNDTGRYSNLARKVMNVITGKTLASNES